MMFRYALRIEYDGSRFVGWQAQTHLPSVQGAVERALAAIDPVFAQGGRIAGAGRTDAGVHATGQVAHADLVREWTPFRLSEALNYHLKPAPISVIEVCRVDSTFHARFSALERRYTFRLISRRAPLTHERGLVWQVRNPLDVDAMRQGAAHLIGTHDFTTFRSSVCQAKSPVKTLDEIRIEPVNLADGQEFRFHLRARSFLHNQVRSIIGTLERVGVGAWTPDQVQDALAACNRAACGPVSPPQGLYLTGVDYPQKPFAT